MLILSSCDFRNTKAKAVILQHLPKPIEDCRVLFVPNEKATHESIVDGKYHRRLEEFGFRTDNVTVFDHTRPDDFCFLDIDLIYISGGNTFATLQKLRDTGFDKDIIRYVQSGVTYIGGSAGAHIASKDIAHVAAFDDVPDDMTDFSGLGLLDGVLICHYTPEREELYAKLKNESSHPVYVLTDDETVTVCSFCKTFGNKEPNTHYPTRIGSYIIPIRDGKVAVVKTPRGYMFIGGGIENGETDEDCILRESLEETGYNAILGEYIGCAESYGYFTNAGNLHLVQRYYVGELDEYKTSPIDNDHTLAWVAYDELKNNMLLDMQNWGLTQCYHKMR